MKINISYAFSSSLYYNNSFIEETIKSSLPAETLFKIPKMQYHVQKKNKNIISLFDSKRLIFKIQSHHKIQCLEVI